MCFVGQPRFIADHRATLEPQDPFAATGEFEVVRDHERARAVGDDALEQGVEPDEREALDRLFQAYVRGGRAAMDEEYRKINPPRSTQPAGDEAEASEE